MRILLVEDDEMIGEAVADGLKGEGYAVDWVKDGNSAIIALDTTPFSLVILDLGLPDSQGTDLLVRLLQNYPALKILVLSGNCDPDSILKALSAGAAGYVPKTLDANLLKSTINFVLEGGVYIPSKILSQQQSMGMSPQQPVVNPSSKVHLTTRQCQVLKLLSQGDSIKTICRKMDLSEGTIKTHVTALYRAFDARNRTEALIAARRNGFNVD
jgi:DNA-binding NarL/FixJ family response regulator